jgi:nitrate reductase gamma subunit
VFVHAFRRTITAALSQRDLSDCDEHRVHRYAHLAVFYGFVALTGLAGVAAVLLATGGSYPLSAGEPLKILGNIASGLLILGCGYFAYERWTATKRGDPSTYFDWVLLGNLLAIGVTGVLCEVFRFQNIPLAAYPTYFLHLVSVLLFLILLPSSKLAHVCYRTVALTSREYETLLRARNPDVEPPKTKSRPFFRWLTESQGTSGDQSYRTAAAATPTRRTAPGE